MNGKLNRVEMQWVILAESREKFTGLGAGGVISGQGLQGYVGLSSGHRGGMGNVGKEVLVEEIGELFVRGSTIVNPLLQNTVGECASHTLGLSSSLLRWVCWSPERVLSLNKVTISRSKSQDPLRTPGSFGSVPTFLLTWKTKKWSADIVPIRSLRPTTYSLGRLYCRFPLTPDQQGLSTVTFITRTEKCFHPW